MDLAPIKKISIIGLGKLGACMAAVYAHSGYQVVGVDINKDFVAALNAGQAPVSETGLNELITANHHRLKATTDMATAISETDLTFIIVPTPSDEAGGFSARFVVTAAEAIGAALRAKQVYHLVVLTSTLLPGDCENQVIPVLEKYSGKRCGVDFGFCYSPEFIAIGSVVHDLLHPDFFLVGEFDQRSGEVLEKFYQSVCSAAPVRRMSIPSAELTKISVNSFLTMKITFANMLTELAEHIPGAHIDHITEALGSDQRIGRRYLRGGLGYGGPCFPRDNRAFASMAEKRGVLVPFAVATDTYNKTIVGRAVVAVQKKCQAVEAVGILGLSYKPGTYFAEESQAIEVTKALVALGHKVFVFDPWGYAHARQFLGESVTYCDSLAECVERTRVLFVSNPDVALDELPALVRGGQVLVDPWRQFIHGQFPAGVEYCPFGIGQGEERARPGSI